MEERLSVLDPSNTGHDGKEMGQEQVGGMVIPISVVWPGDVSLQETSEAQRFAKLMKEEQSAIACQTGCSEEKLKFSGTFGHLAQSFHFVRFVQSQLYRR